MEDPCVFIIYPLTPIITTVIYYINIGENIIWETIMIYEIILTLNDWFSRAFKHVK